MPLNGPSLTTSIDLAKLLDKGLADHPDDIALHSAATSWTWRALDRDANRLARHLIARGLRPGDRVATLMPNRNVLLVFYVACLRARLVITPLNYRYMAPEIDHALGMTKASILLAHAERDDDLNKSELAHKLPLGNITYGATDGRPDTLEDLLAIEPPKVDLPTPLGSDPAIIFFTSGSTGKPKGVTHTFDTYSQVLSVTVQTHEIAGDDLVLPGSSISHAGGIFYSFAALAVGARVILPRTFDGGEILPLLREHRPTFVWMLPAALISLVHEHDARPDDFSSVRVCVSGGDKVPNELEREFTALAGFPIDEAWGMSEIGVATVNPPSGSGRLGSVGKLGAGFAASIRDADGQELPVGQPGQMWVKSPTVTIGYWDRPDATAETIVDGWLDTGDVMEADADGYFWFRGRKKQIIVHDGSNICPQEVEQAVMTHDAIEAVGVVGVHDSVHGENVWAYVTLSDGKSKPLSEAVIQAARSQVGYKAPEKIIFLDEMPLNATGKVDRVTLKKWAADELEGHVE